jgi:hypothetical protein
LIFIDLNGGQRDPTKRQKEGLSKTGLGGEPFLGKPFFLTLCGVSLPPIQIYKNQFENSTNPLKINQNLLEIN